MATLTADVQIKVLSTVMDGHICDVERARMQLEDQRSHALRATHQLIEEVSYIQSHLYNSRLLNTHVYMAACDALEILDPGDPANYD